MHEHQPSLNVKDQVSHACNTRGKLCKLTTQSTHFIVTNIVSTKISSKWSYYTLVSVCFCLGPQTATSTGHTTLLTCDASLTTYHHTEINGCRNALGHLPAEAKKFLFLLTHIHERTFYILRSYYFLNYRTK
jgi:hypothetical protein